MTTREPSPPLKLFLDVGPLAVFFATFSYGRDLLAVPTIHSLMEPLTGAEALAGDSGPLFLATACFVVVSIAALGVSWITTRHVPRMTVVTAVVVAGFGGLTLYLQDETFIKMKPTIVYGVFTAVLGFGLLRGRSYLKALMGTMIPLDEAGWLIFTRRWVMFFIAMALLNEAVWRTQGTETWVTFKTFGVMPLTFLFLMFQAPLLKRHMIEE